MQVPSDIKSLAESILSEQKVELVDLICRRERGVMVLQLLVDKPGGIILDECADLNRRLGEALEQQDLILGRYIVEVGSPGIDRPLKTARDFERTMGEVIRVVDVKGKNYNGKVIGLTKDKIVLENDKGVSEIIPLQDIAVARADVKL